MCFSKKKDNSAQIARAREEARQREIEAGIGQINEAFKGFDDGFYSKQSQAYRDFAAPQLDEQHQDAVKKLTFALSRTGNLNSSVAGERLAEVKRQRDRAAQQIESEAVATGNRIRSDVESARGDLFNQVSATGNASAASNAALNRASALSATPSFGSLGQLFSDTVDAIGAINQGQQARNQINQIRLFNPTGSSGSGTVVRS